MLHRAIILLAPLLAGACGTVQASGASSGEPVPTLWRMTSGLASCTPRSQVAFAAFGLEGRIAPSLSVAPRSRRILLRPNHFNLNEHLAAGASMGEAVE
ncbi:hypothetical protein [Azospirillum brasilense]|uniref:Uncharacterized protein n=1 Tax=Azospirillum brasilense TaxID=192 RepID=A0A235HAU5_AZOBR|nr:hypothetical protein [Azospirillum brasilense]OYD82949.1 hypothetical protein CHT98_17540 [Azospirillum brasilense]